MRGVWGLLFNRLLYNPGPLPCADGGNPAASRRVLLNASQSMFGETSTPSANLLKRHLQPCCNLLVPQTLSRQQHNLGSFRQPYRCTTASPQSFQFLSYLNIKINPRCFPHIYIRRWTSTYISLILADYTSLHVVDARALNPLQEVQTTRLELEIEALRAWIRGHDLNPCPQARALSDKGHTTSVTFSASDHRAPPIAPAASLHPAPPDCF